MSSDFEYILTEVEVYSVVPQEQQTEDTVVPVNIGDIKVRVMGDIADAHGCVCTMSNFRSAAHTPQLQCQLHWMLPLAALGNAYPSLLGNAHPSLLGKYSPSAFSHTDPCLTEGVCGWAIGPP